MLALPAIWLWWYVNILFDRGVQIYTRLFPRSLSLFVFTIVWFMWRTNANPPQDFTFSAAPFTELGFRITISVVLGVMIGYLILALGKFKKYNEKMAMVRKRHNKQLRGDNRPEGNGGGSQQPPEPPQTFLDLSSSPP